MANNSALITEGFRICLNVLTPYLVVELKAVYGDDWWLEGVYSRLFDSYKEGYPKEGTDEELSKTIDIMLAFRIIDFNWDIFKRKHPNEFRAWIKEALAFRNKWAHQSTEEFSDSECARCLDTLSLICSRIDKEAEDKLQKMVSSIRFGSTQNKEPDAKRFGEVSIESQTDLNCIFTDSCEPVEIKDNSSIADQLSRNTHTPSDEKLRMSSFDQLDKCYVKRLNDEKTILKVLDQIRDVKKNSSLSLESRLSKELSTFRKILDKTEIKRDFKLIEDTYSIGNCFLSCIKAINDYRDAFSRKAKDFETKKATQSLFAAHDELEKERNLLFKDTGIVIDSADSISNLIYQCLNRAIEIEEKGIISLKKEAKAIVNSEYPLELDISMPFQSKKSLPDYIRVARFLTQKKAQTILRDIGINNEYQIFSINMRNQGNILLKTDFEHMDDSQIDQFLIAYIFSFIESFPLGSVRVHIFDQNANYLFLRLDNSFRSENLGEIGNSIIQIHSDISDLSSLNGYCKDVFKKTSVENPDLYSVYDKDNSDVFNLVIMRGGLVDRNGYSPSDTLNLINSLSKPGNFGHKCGLRFLIVDNSASFTEKTSNSSKNQIKDSDLHLIKSIQENCEIKIQYSEGIYQISKNKVDVLSVIGNLDLFVQERAKTILDSIRKVEKSSVSLEDVSSGEKSRNVSSIMSIPVGLCGGRIVELPFSCKDEDGTVAGQCIGYMAIGQSGSGKSSFFHSVVINGCLKYSPEDLQFWLLDFKNGGASSKYSNSGVPHIKIIAENNKIDDALCLFQMILEEMERRSKAFNDTFTDNIIEYNERAKEEGLEHFPRIIIAIDEVQEIFRDDTASKINDYISRIASRMRSAGMHFVMVAQNLSDAKSYLLKDSFLKHVSGRICFRVAQDVPRESGFEKEFMDRREEITELKTGEAYVSYGQGTIKKVRMVFISPQEMEEQIFGRIISEYPEYSNMRPFVIGSKKRLSITDSIQGENIDYKSVMQVESQTEGGLNALIGEDVFRMSPLALRFSQQENSSVLFLGSDKNISSSLCTSVAISLIRQNTRVHLFNGDKSGLLDNSVHPFMHICNLFSSEGGPIESHRTDKFKIVMRDIYTEFLERENKTQKTEGEDVFFSPVFLIINDLFGINGFTKNEMVQSRSEETELKQDYLGDFGNFDYDIFAKKERESEDDIIRFKEPIQSIMGTLLKNGYRYNMHVVLAIKGNTTAWRGLSIADDVNNLILFNETQADQISYNTSFNSYILKEMLQNISNGNKSETQAVFVRNKTFSKIRPIIYKMNEKRESDALEDLIKRSLK